MSKTYYSIHDVKYHVGTTHYYLGTIKTYYLVQIFLTI